MQWQFFRPDDGNLFLVFNSNRAQCTTYLLLCSLIRSKIIMKIIRCGAVIEMRCQQKHTWKVKRRRRKISIWFKKSKEKKERNSNNLRASQCVREWNFRWRMLPRACANWNYNLSFSLFVFIQIMALLPVRQWPNCFSCKLHLKANYDLVELHVRQRRRRRRINVQRNSTSTERSRRRNTISTATN